MNFNEIYNKYNSQTEHLQEMAVHCKPQDGYKFVITVGSSIFTNNSTGSKKEHNPPHAHIWSIDRKFYSRFQIVNPDPPKTIEDLKTVDKNDMPLNKYADSLIEWCNKAPKRSANEGDDTNWAAMRSSWKDIQDIVNEGLSNPTFI